MADLSSANADGDSEMSADFSAVAKYAEYQRNRFVGNSDNSDLCVNTE